MKLRIFPLLVVVVAVMALLGVVVHADPPPVDPNTPVVLKTLADGLHIGDNGSILTLRDIKNGVWAMGSSTTLYKEYYVSADGLLGYLPNVQGANAFYAANGRLWVGQALYEHIPQVKALADATGLTAHLLQNGTVGFWGTRDFQNGLWRYGWDAGVTIKF